MLKTACAYHRSPRSSHHGLRPILATDSRNIRKVAQVQGSHDQTMMASRGGDHQVNNRLGLPSATQDGPQVRIGRSHTSIKGKYKISVFEKLPVSSPIGFRIPLVKALQKFRMNQCVDANPSITNLTPSSHGPFMRLLPHWLRVNRGVKQMGQRHGLIQINLTREVLGPGRNLEFLFTAGTMRFILSHIKRPALHDRCGRSTQRFNLHPWLSTTRNHDGFAMFGHMGAKLRQLGFRLE